MSHEMELPEGVYSSEPRAESPAVVRVYVNEAGQVLRVWVRGNDPEALTTYLEGLVIAFGTSAAEEIEEEEVPPNDFPWPYGDEPPDIEIIFEFPGLAPPFTWSLAVDPTIWGFRSNVYTGPYSNITATITFLGNETSLFLPNGQVDATANNQVGQLNGWTSWVVVRGQTEGANSYNLFINGATFTLSS